MSTAAFDSESDVYLTPREAAAYLKLSPVTLAQWRCKDRGPAFLKLGAAVRYARRDLDAWAEAQRVPAGDAQVRRTVDLPRNP